MERPCPEYFNGVKYNTTRECPSSSAAGSAPDAGKRPRFRERGRLRTQRRRPAEGRGGVTPLALRTPYNVGGAPSVPYPTIASDLSKTVICPEPRKGKRKCSLLRADLSHTL